MTISADPEIRNEHYSKAEKLIADLMDQIKNKNASFILCYRTEELVEGRETVGGKYNTLGIFPSHELDALVGQIDEFLADMNSEAEEPAQPLVFPMKTKGLPN